MKILFDCRMLFMSGIGRYIRDILAYLPKLAGDTQLVLVGDPEQIRDFLGRQPELRKIINRVTHFRAPIYSMAEHVHGSLLLNRFRRQIDLFHFPHYNVPWMEPENSVVTVHDLIHFHFPEYYGGVKVKLAKGVLENAVKKASRIIVDSQATANDLVQMFPGMNEKVRIIHIGVSEFFGPQPVETVDAFKKQQNLGQYLLYVGNRKPHKNLERLLKAYAGLKTKFPALQLVIVGKRFDEQDEVTRLIKELRLENVVEIERASDNEILHLYCGAEALVLPSLYEGFGLPPLEAMACGTPVVVSNTSSVPEVVGEAGVYVDPYNVVDITRGVYQVLTDQNLRHHLREKGLVQARLFTWEKTTRQTLEVYQEVVERPRK